jgi:hypothetical protein
MIRKFIFLVLVLFLSADLCTAQSFVKTADIFPNTNDDSRSGKLNIFQNPAIDTLINRYILINTNLYKANGYFGMEGFRIQIYRSGDRNAREESNKVRAEFMEKFPDIVSYQIYDNPGWFSIRIGDFRTKSEGLKTYLLILKEFPHNKNIFFVPDFIHFPDLEIK